MKNTARLQSWPSLSGELEDALAGDGTDPPRDHPADECGDEARTAGLVRQQEGQQRQGQHGELLEQRRGQAALGAPLGPGHAPPPPTPAPISVPSPICSSGESRASRQASGTV